MISKVINFVKNDIWRIRLKNLPPKKSFLIKQLRVIVLALRGFGEDKCQLRASALTFYTLLSIVPVAAMAFGVAKGFGYQKLLEKQMLEKFPGQEEVSMQVITFANSLLENAKGGMIAGIGVAILFWTVIKVLGNIEKSFNDIWGIKKPRALGRKFSDYLSIMLICPMLVIVSSSITVFITTMVKTIVLKFALLGFFGPVIFLALRLLPYCLIWFLLTFIYSFMPNTKVNFRSALIAGIISGTIYEIVQRAYIYFQVGASKYNAIYGSFAALPLFLIWVQLSWLIVLFGAELSFAHQNVDTYEFEPDCLRVSYSFKKRLTLRIANLLVKNFSNGIKPWTAEQISHDLEIPIRLVRQILFELVDSEIISEARINGYKDVAYQPARNVDTLTIRYVIDAIEKKGVDDLPVANTSELEVISGSLQKIEEEIEKSSENKLLKEI